MADAETGAGRRGPYRNGERRRAQILDGALAAFAELGYAGGSVREIARRAGASPASVFQHFGTKEGLLIAVLGEWDRRGPDEAGLDEAEGLAYFRRIPAVMAYNARHRGLVELFLTMVTEASHAGHPARAFIVERYARNRATISAHIRLAMEAGDAAGLVDGDVPQEAQSLTALLDGIELQWLLDPGIDIVGVTSRNVELMIHRWGAGRSPGGG